jgi:hypothetical protein
VEERRQLRAIRGSVAIMRYFDDPIDGYWPGEPAGPAGKLAERVTHLVFVDGRLIDHWSESALGTRWQPFADRFDLDRRPPPPPATPPYERVLRWLDGICGGRAAVLGLSDRPLEDDGRDLPEAPSSREQHRLAEVAELLDGVASARFDAEIGLALRSALLTVHAADPSVVTQAPTAERAAGAIAWAVAKANGLLHPGGTLRLRDLQDGLGLRGSPSTYGRVVERALVGFRDLGVSPGFRPHGLPDLLPLGRPELLLGRVRERLVRVRDQALEAQRTNAA